ncbi:MAG: lipoprotein-releasing ABC transporter ATP-binding protein LolD [Oceanospirillaceae bacterium]|nr:lipoprotein-releasing ABC transporter ATP-binding protein LolD [Oceanospirillaceae bacterium]
MNNVMVCENITRTFTEAGSQLQVLKDISFNIARGERVAIMGASGSGKTTLLNTIGGLEAPCGGTVKIDGESLYEVSERKRTKLRNQKLGFVYQFHHLLPEFSALENVAIPLLLAGVAKQEAIDKSTALLSSVGLQERLNHKPAKLSGGERQRVAIARALVTKPACVLMDEPTGNLDANTALDIQTLMDELNVQYGISFIVVTHDEKLALRMDRILVLKDGQLTQRS